MSHGMPSSRQGGDLADLMRLSVPTVVDDECFCAPGGASISQSDAGGELLLELQMPNAECRGQQDLQRVCGQPS
jgi:hypothetical protein